MDKLLRDIENFCKTTTKEREESYRASCRMAEIGEMLLQVKDEESLEEVSGKLDGLLSMSFDDWREQQLTDEEMDRLKTRDDMNGMADSMLSRGNMMAKDEDGLPIYGKPCEEILRDMVDELQDMIELIEYMEGVEDHSINDTLLALEANISEYNSGRGV